MILEKFIRDHRAEFARHSLSRPIVGMQMPPIPTLRSFFSEVLRALDCTVTIGSRLSELKHDALRQLEKAQPRIIAIDELHHLLACTPREQCAALNVLKFISNEFRVSLVALGTSDALHVMRTDLQIASRFESCALAPWTATEELRSFVAGFTRQLNFDPGDVLGGPVGINYILELTNGVTGRIVEMLRLCAKFAFRKGIRSLDMDSLQKAGKEFAGDLGSELIIPAHGRQGFQSIVDSDSI